MQLFAKFKKILYVGFRATLNFRKFKLAMNPMYIREFKKTIMAISNGNIVKQEILMSNTMAVQVNDNS